MFVSVSARSTPHWYRLPRANALICHRGERRERATEGGAVTLTGPMDGQRSTWAQSALAFGLAAMNNQSSPLWVVCLPCCHLIAAAVCSHTAPPTPTLPCARLCSPSSPYLLCRIYLTHSSRRGNKLALGINLTDNYSQETIQRKE